MRLERILGHIKGAAISDNVHLHANRLKTSLAYSRTNAFLSSASITKEPKRPLWAIMATRESGEEACSKYPCNPKMGWELASGSKTHQEPC